jgi:hypothetical protein
VKFLAAKAREHVNVFIGDDVPAMTIDRYGNAGTPHTTFFAGFLSCHTGMANTTNIRPLSS